MVIRVNIILFQALIDSNGRGTTFFLFCDMYIHYEQSTIQDADGDGQSLSVIEHVHQVQLRNRESQKIVE